MKKALLLTVFCILSHLLVAQNAIFQVQNKIYSLPDTIVRGSTHIFGTYVKNIGDPYTGNFHYRLSVYNWQLGCYCATMDETIPLVNFSQGDSAFIPFTETFNTTGNSKYRMGGNIVVIWPKNSMNYSVTNDEAYKHFTIVNQNNGNGNITSVRDKFTEDEEIAEKTVYPNPFTNELEINTATLTSQPEKITILNLQGQKVKELEIANPLDNIKFSTTDLGKGIYFLNIYQKNKELKIVRIIKYKD
jgi:hypothetical protein